MQQYQPYSMNNYLPMQNNPYMSRMAQMPQYQQTMPSMMNGLSTGKIVENVDMLKTIEVPMDGSIYYFPKADGTEVYSKQWLSNGTTRILTYKPILDEKADNVSNDDEKLKIGLSDEFTEGIMQRFDKLEQLIDDFISKPTPKTRTSSAKKESDE